MTVTAIIPARFASTRLPGKPLLAQTGKSLVQHVFERVAAVSGVNQVLVATDDERIVAAVQSFSGQVVMTRSDHPTGTDRIAEVASELDTDLILNVQGDEPEIDPDHLQALIERMGVGADMGTLACPFPADADPADPNAVKVVIDQRGRALYFSRALIPFPREPQDAVHPYLHIGVYAYRREFLLKYATWPTTPLERCEKLEQLRALENGVPIEVVTVSHAAPGIDTPADYADFVKRMTRHG